MQRPITIEVPDVGRVTARWMRPDDATAAYVLAHGAGAGMHHAFMEGVAETLADRRIATLRYQFPYIEAGRRSPDPPARLQATVRAAVTRVAELDPNLLVVAGGKSLGGRMTSMAQAEEALPYVRGLVFLGFPLHAPKRPSDKRAEHLRRVNVPMLFVQGTRDNLADLRLLSPIIKQLGASVHIVEDGDHSFKVPKRTGRSAEEVLAELADAIGSWVCDL